MTYNREWMEERNISERLWDLTLAQPSRHMALSNYAECVYANEEDSVHGCRWLIRLNNGNFLYIYVQGYPSAPLNQWHVTYHTSSEVGSVTRYEGNQSIRRQMRLAARRASSSEWLREVQQVMGSAITPPKTFKTPTNPLLSVRERRPLDTTMRFSTSAGQAGYQATPFTVYRDEDFPDRISLSDLDNNLYLFNQHENNGLIVRNNHVGDLVVIEARNEEVANRTAARIGIYFDGVASGEDCGGSCCNGDRWERASRRTTYNPIIVFGTYPIGTTLHLYNDLGHMAWEVRQ